MQNVEILTQDSSCEMDNAKLKILDKTPLHKMISDYKST